MVGADVQLWKGVFMLDMKATGKKKFVENLFEAAKKLRAEGRKINPAVCSAQAALESAYGTSKLSRDACNFFGIKAGKSWKGEAVQYRTREYSKEKIPFDIVASFRKYPNIEACLSDYARIIETLSWYRDAAANADAARHCRSRASARQSRCPSMPRATMTSVGSTGA